MACFGVRRSTCCSARSMSAAIVKEPLHRAATVLFLSSHGTLVLLRHCADHAHRSRSTHSNAWSAISINLRFFLIFSRRSPNACLTVNTGSSATRQKNSSDLISRGTTYHAIHQPSCPDRSSLSAAPFSIWLSQLEDADTADQRKTRSRTRLPRFRSGPIL